MRPGMGLRRKTSGQGGNVEQYWFNPFQDRQPGQPRCIDLRRTKELSGGANEHRVIRVFAQTQGHADFLIAQFGMVGRQVRRKITLVMTCAPADRAFEQPFTGATGRSSGHPANVLQQG